MLAVGQKSSAYTRKSSGETNAKAIQGHEAGNGCQGQQTREPLKEVIAESEVFTLQQRMTALRPIVLKKSLIGASCWPRST